MKLKEAKQITGHKSGLGKPSKMPGFSTSLSAFDCKVGSKLAKVEGSVCSKCYAFNGNYQWPAVKQAHQARLEALQHPKWVEAMTILIGHYTNPSDPYFRIHDSGDIQSVEHLLQWVQVAKNLPDIKFWMPTKEHKMYKVGKNIMGPTWPENLVVRLSAPMIGKCHRHHSEIFRLLLFSLEMDLSVKRTSAETSVDLAEHAGVLRLKTLTITSSK